MPTPKTTPKTSPRASPGPSVKEIDTKQWKAIDQHKDVKIEKFVATAVKMPGEFDASGKKQLIHWRGAVAYHDAKKGGDAMRSTSLDTRKLSKTDPAIQVQLISKDFAVSSKAAGHWETPVTPKGLTKTTTDIYNLLKEKKFNQYLYNGNGSGCKTWTTALIKLLENEGILPAGSEVKFLAKVAEVSADPKLWVPDEPGATFY